MKFCVKPKRRILLERSDEGMCEVLVSATLLIGLILLLRYLTKGRISMRLRYALWIMAALRLILPISFGSSTLSVLNLVPVWASGTGQVTEAGNIPESGKPAGKTDYDMESSAGQEKALHVPQAMAEQSPEQKPDVQNQERTGIEPGSIRPLQANQIRFFVTILWIVGMVGTGGYMAVNQLRLVRYLHRLRTEVLTDGLPWVWASVTKADMRKSKLRRRRIRVFLVKGLPSPCLVGRDIYIEPQTLQDEVRLRHVLAHEYVHYIQGDTLWAVLRSILCVVYWFYPLVWVAAYAARRDSELSCDECVIRLLGEKERFSYGRTLLDLFAGRVERIRCAGTVLIMGGRENSVKERISMIAARKKSSRITAVLVVLTVVLGCGCAFTGPETADSDAAGNKKEILLTNEGDLLSEDTDGQEVPGEEKAVPEEQSEGIEQEEALAEQTEFEKLLYSMEDSTLEAAGQVDLSKYYEYIIEGGACPLKDGRWYRLLQEGESGIEFYGLYTEKYGCRGMKIEIDGDVNTFDEPWLPAPFGIKVDILEKAESDGLPRSFAFAECVVNNSTSEIWRLYVADRYDTGTIELYCFEEEDYRRQIEEQGIEFLFTEEQEERTVRLVSGEEEEIDSVVISRYDGDDVEEVIWDEESVCFLMRGEGRENITLITGIGLKSANSSEARFGALPLIEFPVDIGSFGEHKFLLIMPKVSDAYVSGKVDR